MQRALWLFGLFTNVCCCGIMPVTVAAAEEVVFDPADRTASNPVLHVPLVKTTVIAATGQPLKFQGSVGFTIYKGMMCARFDANGSIRIDGNSDAFGRKPGTITLWIYPQDYDGLMYALDIGDQAAQNKRGLLSICVQNGYLAWSCGALDITTPVLCAGRWSFIAATFDGIKATLYCDGKKVEEKALTAICDSPQFCIGGLSNVFGGASWRGHLAAVTVYDRVLPQSQLINLANEFQQPVSATNSIREKDDLSYDDSTDKYKHLGILISRKDNCSSDDITGEALNKEEFKIAAARLMSALDKLPESCIKNSGINNIVILHSLRYKNVLISGFSHGDCMYFLPEVDARTIYHEFFHRFDNQKQSAEWKRFNADRFTYLDRGNSSANKSRFTSGKPGGIQKLIDNNRRYADDFVSAYAMTNEREDRAETFASMVEEGPAFLSRTKQNEVLKQKMLYIIKLTDSSNIMGKDYWPEHLNLQKNAD